MKKLLLLFAILATIGCKKDSIEEQIEKGDHPIVGAWNATKEYTSDDVTDISYYLNGESLLLEFQTNGIVVITSGYFGRNGLIENTSRAPYSVIGNGLFIGGESSDEEDTVTFRIKGDTLFIDTYTQIDESNDGEAIYGTYTVEFKKI